MRLAHTQVWPVLRYLAISAPLTAASTSASSKTMKGALPPSSSDSFLIVGAHCAISSRPTSVEPVNESLRTTGLAVSSPPIATGSPVSTLKTPAGKPGLLGQRRQRQRGQRRLLGGLDDDRAAGRQCRGDLARDHRQREVPRRDRRADADRLLDDHQPLVGDASPGWSRHRCACLPRRTTRRTRRRRPPRPWLRPAACRPRR